MSRINKIHHLKYLCKMLLQYCMNDQFFYYSFFYHIGQYHTLMFMYNSTALKYSITYNSTINYYSRDQISFFFFSPPFFPLLYLIFNILQEITCKKPHIFDHIQSASIHITENLQSL